jgi:hypothetical protein
LFRGLYQRHHLLFIIRGLRHRLSHNQLKNRLDRHLFNADRTLPLGIEYAATLARKLPRVQ